jgi:hypothetical protein
MGPTSGVHARNPPAITPGRGDPAVEGGGELEVYERPSGAHVVEILLVLPLEEGVA